MTDSSIQHHSQPLDPQGESENWLAWLDNPSPADLEWIAQLAYSRRKQ